MADRPRPSSSECAPVVRGLCIHRHGHPRVALRLDPAHRYTFGRTARSKILLPDQRASRAHGDLEVVGSSWAFTDLGSANGSFLFRVEDFFLSESDGGDLSCVRLTPGNRGRLRPGEGILLGSRDAWIEMLAAPPPGALTSLDGVNPRSVLEALGLLEEEGVTPDLRTPRGPLPRPFEVGTSQNQLGSK